MPVISNYFFVNSAYLGTEPAKIFDLKLLKSSICLPRLSQMSALFYLALLSSQYISLSAGVFPRIFPGLFPGVFPGVFPGMFPGVFPGVFP